MLKKHFIFNGVDFIREPLNSQRATMPGLVTAQRKVPTVHTYLQQTHEPKTSANRKDVCWTQSTPMPSIGLIAKLNNSKCGRRLGLAIMRDRMIAAFKSWRYHPWNRAAAESHFSNKCFTLHYPNGCKVDLRRPLLVSDIHYASVNSF